MNLMKVDGYHAKIEYDEETDQFRGEILGISGGADFYGSSPDEPRREFQKSLEVFLEVCKEQGIEPRRNFSGKFNLRIPPELHEKLAVGYCRNPGKELQCLGRRSAPAKPQDIEERLTYALPSSPAVESSCTQPIDHCFGQGDIG
jgi:predicted HicB family RNase H-like nuclease